MRVPYNDVCFIVLSPFPIFFYYIIVFVFFLPFCFWFSAFQSDRKQEIGVDVARKYKEHEVVIDAIQSHHGDVEPKSIIACIVQAADAISAARPGARRENLESYIKRLEKLEEVASSFEGVERCFAIQAGREVRIMVKPEVVDDDQMVLLARDICRKIESDLEYPGQIKVNMVRESRAIEYAK